MGSDPRFLRLDRLLFLFVCLRVSCVQASRAVPSSTSRAALSPSHLPHSPQHPSNTTMSMRQSAPLTSWPGLSRTTAPIVLRGGNTTRHQTKVSSIDLPYIATHDTTVIPANATPYPKPKRAPCLSYCANLWVCCPVFVCVCSRVLRGLGASRHGPRPPLAPSPPPPQGAAHHVRQTPNLHHATVKEVDIELHD